MKFEDITQIQMILSDTGTLWLTDPETAVIVIVYVPAGVPGLPLPPPPPCNPPPHMERVASAALGTGAVVAIVKATTESPLPEPTCGGLNLHVVNAGSLEHKKVTLFGKLPVVGFTSMLKLAGCPTGTEVLAGVIPMVKSKV
jgi:hypothetical protein